MEGLQKDIDELRERMPHNLVSIDNPKPINYYVSDQEIFVIDEVKKGAYIDPVSDGRFLIQDELPASSPDKFLLALAVDMQIRAPEGTAYDHSIHDVRVTFIDLALAQVGFRSRIDHPNLRTGLISSPEFFEMVMRLAGERGILMGILIALQKFFKGPMHPCPRCDSFYEAFTNMEKERAVIAYKYRAIAKHPALFSPGKIEWDNTWFAPEFIKAIESGTDEALSSILTEEAEGVFSFPIFSQKFCDMLMDEVDNYAASGLPKKRPNSMNNYGLILNEIGMANFFTQFQRKYLQRLSSYLFPIQGASLDDHHSFIVQYKQGEDLGLDMHIDDSEVTLNVCLGREFSGAGLTFCGNFGHSAHRKKSLAYHHVVGRAILHLGSRRHGADDISTGERLNLIVWNRCHAFRSCSLMDRWPGEDAEGGPDLVCLSRTHDQDYDLQFLKKFKEEEKERKERK
uniref:Fe2OG dioxygenase domain-containing protein n=1 Tax=Paramoeba aestuarina TaxID=180227 RepID=A0A7S4P4C6_9EUKA